MNTSAVDTKIAFPSEKPVKMRQWHCLYPNRIELLISFQPVPFWDGRWG